MYLNAGTAFLFGSSVYWEEKWWIIER